MQHLDLDTLVLARGAHENRAQGVCLLDVASAAYALIAAADHYADMFARARHPLSMADAAARQRDAYDALRAALDRLEASTHDASGGPPAPHRRPSEDPT